MTDSNEELVHLFSAGFGADQNARMQAELRLRELEHHDGMLRAVLQVVASNTLDTSVRQAAGIYLKNRVTKVWDAPEATDDKAVPIGPNDRKALKDNIFAVLLDSPTKIQAQLKTAFDSMVRGDFPEDWPGLAENVSSALGQQSNERTVGALVALGVILNASRYKKKEERRVVDAVIVQTFPQLVHIGSSLLANTPVDQAPEHVSLLLHLIFKCYRYTVHQHLSAYQRSQESIVPWGTLFLQVVNRQSPSSVVAGDPEDRERLEWWKAKKWAYAILNMLFARFGSPSQLSKSSRADYGQFAQTFEANFAPEILKVYMRQVELLISGQIWLSNRCKRHIIDFLTECIKPKSMWLQLKPHVSAILDRFIFPIYCMTDDQLEQFTEEPADFVREHMADAFSEYFRLPITAAEQFLEELVNKRKTMLPVVLQFVSGVVSKYPQERTPRDKDAALRMIAGIAAAVKGREFGKHLQAFVMQFVVPEFSSPHGILRARACDVVNKLEAEDMEWSDPAQLHTMLEGCLGLLTDPELPVRVAAALTLPELSRYEQVRTILAPNIGRVMQDLLNSSNQVEIDRLTMATRELFQSFSQELMPFAVQLSAQLTATYLRLATEVVAATKEESADYDENKSLTAMSNLRALEQLLESVEDVPDHLAIIESQVLPAINYTLQNEVHILYDEVFEILDSFLFYQKKVSPAMWQTFELLFACFKGDGLDYIDEMMPVWDNFISYGSQQIVANPSYLEALVSIVETSMTSERLGAEDRCSAIKVAESLFLNMRGSIDNYIPRLLHHALSFLFRPPEEMDNQPVVSDHLYMLSLELLVNAIYYDPALTFNYLAQHSATSGVLQKWLKNVDKFTRVHDRKLGILAVVAILEHLQSLPQEVIQAAPSLIAATVVFFDGLPAAIKNRQKEEETAINGKEESDDDDDDLGAEEGEEAPEGDVNGADDEDVEGDDIDEDLIASIVREKIREAKGLAAAADHEEGEDEEEELWEEEVLFTSPLDNVDAYVSFSQLLLALQRDFPSSLNQLTGDQQRKLQNIVSVATAGGETTLKKKEPPQNGHVTIPGP